MSRWMVNTTPRARIAGGGAAATPTPAPIVEGYAFARTGTNLYGEGGDSDLTISLSPKELTPPFEAVDIACGSVSSIALSADGKIYLTGRGLLRPDSSYVEGTSEWLEYPMPNELAGHIVSVHTTKVPCFIDCMEPYPMWVDEILPGEKEPWPTTVQPKRLTNKPTDSYFVILDNGDLWGWGVTTCGAFADAAMVDNPGDRLYRPGSGDPIIPAQVYDMKTYFHLLTLVPTPQKIAEDVKAVVSLHTCTFILDTSGNLLFCGFDQFGICPIEGTGGPDPTLIDGFFNPYLFEKADATQPSAPPYYTTRAFMAFAPRFVKISEQQFDAIDGAGAHVNTFQNYYYQTLHYNYYPVAYAECGGYWGRIWTAFAIVLAWRKGDNAVYQWMGYSDGTPNCISHAYDPNISSIRVWPIPETKLEIDDTVLDVALRRYHPKSYGTRIMGIIACASGRILDLSASPNIVMSWGGADYGDGAGMHLLRASAAYGHVYYGDPANYILRRSYGGTSEHALHRVQIGAGVEPWYEMYIQSLWDGSKYSQSYDCVDEKPYEAAMGGMDAVGYIYGWGNNASGQAGIGLAQTEAGREPAGTYGAPLRINALPDHIRLSFGNTHALILREEDE